MFILIDMYLSVTGLYLVPLRSSFICKVILEMISFLVRNLSSVLNDLVDISSIEITDFSPDTPQS